MLWTAWGRVAVFEVLRGDVGECWRVYLERRGESGGSSAARGDVLSDIGGMSRRGRSCVPEGGKFDVKGVVGFELDRGCPEGFGRLLCAVGGEAEVELVEVAWKMLERKRRPMCKQKPVIVPTIGARRVYGRRVCHVSSARSSCSPGHAGHTPRPSKKSVIAMNTDEMLEQKTRNGKSSSWKGRNNSSRTRRKRRRGGWMKR